ncbi:Glycosyltransferase involved in cell wall bisynthesis [Salinimicrobium catena]|uniref:Glycosyltransferase involved in cell wall bisynthesis n=1 Tax=Salinimicrobium catena TaxID=390640 RepID=A0A1H5LMK3_9FLAO|nr:glycosyltransferase family 2 protein [Salinimicrobium catena]SDL11764.1 Glycosyltransferase involved in cell wall bisynthesis [Salinimicrobium catena]SEE78262.1 Glycosyltransferase involved in cell wall bisynthesis [Salinimicrobium catena]
MNTEPLLQSKFDSLQCCVLIPTYNNAKTLKRVLEGVLNYTANIIVVNDGSTDHTPKVLHAYNQLQVIDLPRNKGKGNALRTGFEAAAEAGYEYAITMDSDGQHFPDDLPVFLNALEEKAPNDPELLVIGSRKMDDPSVPQKSSFGNRCSSFWYWVETGVKLQDTQCGYRLYPVRTVNQLDLFTSRFELEIEVIVKAAWEGVEVKNLPVKVLYDPDERVTHFKPFRDVARITLLNIWFVGIALFYILPRNIFRKINGGMAGKEFSDTKLPLE